MRLAVLLNSSAGSVGAAACEQRAREVREAFENYGAHAEVVLCPPAQLTRTARQLAAQRYDVVVAAGGDGTVSAVAGGLAGTQTPLAVLPFGTLNHFAKDLAMPLELDEAAKAIVEGTTETIDVGEVNGRVFINNSSIGLYPEAVVVRDDHRKKRGWSKLPAMLLAVARVLYRFPLLGIHIDTPESSIVTETPFVFFGNNEYATTLPSVGSRACLDKGKLCVHTVRAQGRAKMLWLVIRAMFKHPKSIEDFEAQQVTRAKVQTTKRHLKVALDGEVVRMRSPLEYRIRPGALQVRRPPAVVAVEAEEEPIAVGAAG
jgi:diacylglycerol kinase family enzyme